MGARGQQGRLTESTGYSVVCATVQAIILNFVVDKVKPSRPVRTVTACCYVNVD